MVGLEPPKPRRAVSAARLLALFLGVGATLVGAALWYCTSTPGVSFSGDAPALSGQQPQIATELKRHVAALSVGIGERRATHGDSLQRAERYLEAELQPLSSQPGITVRREVVQGSPGDAANVVLELPGKRTSPLVLLGAHYDSAPGGTPAANDNGSGSAAALVLAARLATEAHTLPIRVVFFANEEMPYFTAKAMGSLQHAQGCKRRGEQLRAMFSLETMGYYSDAPGSQKYPAPLSSLYPDRGNFIGFVANLRSRTLLHDTLRRFRRHATLPSEGAALPEALPGVGWSDHWAFWQQGYPALMVTDTAVFRDPNYHQLSDTIDQLDFERLARVVDALHAVVLELAEDG